MKPYYNHISSTGMYVHLSRSSVCQHVFPIGVSNAVKPLHRSIVSLLTKNLHLLIHLIVIVTIIIETVAILETTRIEHSIVDSSKGG